MSLDGFIAGPNQSVEHPLGSGGERLHEWVVALAAWRSAHGLDGGVVNESTAVLDESMRNLGATIMGRNMFGGHPGPWAADRTRSGRYRCLAFSSAISSAMKASGSRLGVVVTLRSNP